MIYDGRTETVSVGELLPNENYKQNADVNKARRRLLIVLSIKLVCRNID